MQKEDDLFPVISQKFPKSKVKYLLPLGDIHFDSRYSDRKLIKAKIREIEKKKYLTLIIGDTLDKLFLSWLNSNENDLILNDAEEMMTDLLYPIREQILAIYEGNHEWGYEKQTGYNISRRIAKNLKVEYIKGMGIIHLRVGSFGKKTKRMNSYVFLVTHGWGGGRKKGGKVNKADELSHLVENIDMAIMGHVHDPNSLPSGTRRYDPRKEKVFEKNLRCITLSSFLKYSLYAQKKGMRPSATIEYLIEMSGKQKEIIIHEREM